MTSQDPYNIVPRGSWAAAVRPLNIQVRTMAEYDIDYMRDRITAEVFINGRNTRIRAVAMVDDRRYPHPASLQDAVEHYAPELERMVIDELVGGRLRDTVEVQGNLISELRSRVNEMDRRSDRHVARIASLEREVHALRQILDRPNWVVRAALAVRTKLGSWFS